jgi:hypothetical protein
VFLAHAERTDGRRLLSRHRKLAQSMSDEFRRLFPQLAGRALQLVFRVGYAKPAPVRSLRRLPPHWDA